MRRALIVLALVLPGCSVDQQFRDGVDAAWQVIGPEYRAYVQADETISDESRTTRLRTADLLSKLLETAKEE